MWKTFSWLPLKVWQPCPMYPPALSPSCASNVIALGHTFLLEHICGFGTFVLQQIAGVFFTVEQKFSQTLHRISPDVTAQCLVFSIIKSCQSIYFKSTFVHSEGIQNKHIAFATISLHFVFTFLLKKAEFIVLFALG